jgi:simple sugar transport system substrate-binding protein
LVRYLSTGDIFEDYLAGAEAQATALGVDLRIFDSRQYAALQSDMVNQAIALGMDGIAVPPPGFRRAGRLRQRAD